MLIQIVVSHQKRFKLSGIPVDANIVSRRESTSDWNSV
jgi:hypothetical protein